MIECEAAQTYLIFIWPSSKLNSNLPRTSTSQSSQRCTKKSHLTSDSFSFSPHSLRFSSSPQLSSSHQNSSVDNRLAVIPRHHGFTSSLQSWQRSAYHRGCLQNRVRGRQALQRPWHEIGARRSRQHRPLPDTPGNWRSSRGPMPHHGCEQG